MRRVDLHDDALLDRAREHALSEVERTRLLKHCESCAACALELGWIDEQLHAQAPSPLDHLRARNAVDAVLGVALSTTQIPAPSAQPSMRVRKSYGRAPKTAALAFLGLFVTSAAAAFFTGAAQYVQTTWLSDGASEASVPAIPSKSRSLRKNKPTKRPQALAKPQLEPPAVPVPQLTASAEIVAPAVPASQLAAAEALAPQPTAAGVVGHEVSALDPDSKTLKKSALSASNVTTLGLAPAVNREAASRTLFTLANAARGRGDYSLAVARYTELSRRYPGTASELIARISQGNLLLTHFDAASRARTVFASYLADRPEGALAEEARVGLGRALFALGRFAEERALWEELVAKHQTSLHLSHARARLAVLAD